MSDAQKDTKKVWARADDIWSSALEARVQAYKALRKAKKAYKRACKVCEHTGAARDKAWYACEDAKETL